MKPATIDEALDTLIENCADNAHLGGYRYEFKSEALAAIEQLVIERVIGEDEQLTLRYVGSRKVNQQDNAATLAKLLERSIIRQEQRQSLRKLIRGDDA